MKTRNTLQDLANFHHDLLVTMQAAIIEWRHGRGAEAAMLWVENTLDGPGLLPDANDPYGRDPQMWMSANRHDRWQACFCGNPSHIMWMGHGFCCDEHYKDGKKQYLDAATKADEGE